MWLLASDTKRQCLKRDAKLELVSVELASIIGVIWCFKIPRSTTRNGSSELYVQLQCFAYALRETSQQLRTSSCSSDLEHEAKNTTESREE